MKKWMQKHVKNEKGLTLVELLAVIVILAIIAAIAIPAIGNIITNSKVNALKADGLAVLNAADLYFIENPEATGTVPITTLKEFIKDTGGFAETTPVDVEVTKVNDGSNTLTGTATNGSVIVKFDKATKKDINDAKTEATTEGKVQITR